MKNAARSLGGFLYGSRLSIMKKHLSATFASCLPPSDKSFICPRTPETKAKSEKRCPHNVKDPKLKAAT